MSPVRISLMLISPFQGDFPLILYWFVVFSYNNTGVWECQPQPPCNNHSAAAFLSHLMLLCPPANSSVLVDSPISGSRAGLLYFYCHLGPTWSFWHPTIHSLYCVDNYSYVIFLSSAWLRDICRQTIVRLLFMFSDKSLPCSFQFCCSPVNPVSPLRLLHLLWCSVILYSFLERLVYNIKSWNILGPSWSLFNLGQGLQSSYHQWQGWP